MAASLVLSRRSMKERRRGVGRLSSPARRTSDAWLAGWAAVHGALLLAVPSVPLIAAGLWWNANTIAHNAIHRPLFRARSTNALMSAYLSLLLGFPQTLWRERHLAHHAGRRPNPRASRRFVVETCLVLLLWAGLASVSPSFFLRVYLPGYFLGLALCWLQGYYEHARGTTSHYGRLYNRLFLNDGYHVEHHAAPHARFSELPGMRRSATAASRWPPVLRWLDSLSLEGLERIVVRSPALQRLVVRWHADAFRRLLGGLSGVRRVTIVGGGLFPRSALVLSEMLPEARITVVDKSRANLDVARSFLAGRAVELTHGLYRPSVSCDLDLLVIPLSFWGERDDVYSRPPARAVLVHDWIWRPRGSSAVVSWLLLKRVNLVR